MSIFRHTFSLLINKYKIILIKYWVIHGPRILTPISLRVLSCHPVLARTQYTCTQKSIYQKGTHHNHIGKQRYKWFLSSPFKLNWRYYHILCRFCLVGFNYFTKQKKKQKTTMQSTEIAIIFILNLCRYIQCNVQKKKNIKQKNMQVICHHVIHFKMVHIFNVFFSFLLLL